MLLYEVSPRSVVKVIKAEEPPPGGIPVGVGDLVSFYHTDGMYSYCKDKDGNEVHLKAWTEVEVVGSLS